MRCGSGEVVSYIEGRVETNHTGITSTYMGRERVIDLGTYISGATSVTEHTALDKVESGCRYAHRAKRVVESERSSAYSSCICVVLLYAKIYGRA